MLAVMNCRKIEVREVYGASWHGAEVYHFRKGSPFKLILCSRVLLRKMQLRFGPGWPGSTNARCTCEYADSGCNDLWDDWYTIEKCTGLQWHGAAVYRFWERSPLELLLCSRVLLRKMQYSRLVQDALRVIMLTAGVITCGLMYEKK